MNLKEIIKYLFFGVLTTLINIALYFFMQDKMSHLLANTIAWFVSVVFAYITNALWVFDDNKLSFKQFIEFCGSRLTTLILENIMIIVLETFIFNQLVLKVITNVVVIILNYILSKVFVFKKERNG